MNRDTIIILAGLVILGGAFYYSLARGEESPQLSEQNIQNVQPELGANPQKRSEEVDDKGCPVAIASTTATTREEFLQKLQSAPLFDYSVDEVMEKRGNCYYAVMAIKDGNRVRESVGTVIDKQQALDAYDARIQSLQETITTLQNKKATLEAL